MLWVQQTDKWHDAMQHWLHPCPRLRIVHDNITLVCVSACVCLNFDICQLAGAQKVKAMSELPLSHGQEQVTLATA